MNRIFLTILLSIATPAWAGPFGLEMGQSIASVKGKPTSNPGQYSIEVPTPNTQFEDYSGWASAKTGLCRVSAYGKTYENDAYGTKVRAGYENLKSLLVEKYGSGETEERLKAGALWSGPREWVMSIKQNEREHRIRWSHQQDDLSDNLQSITLTVKALDADRSWILLSYNFRNLLACSDGRGPQDRAGL